MKRILQDLYVYVSENELVPDFKSGKELVWEQNGIVYGDWTGGPFGDSSYELRTKIATSEVNDKHLFPNDVSSFVVISVFEIMVVCTFMYSWSKKTQLLIRVIELLLCSKFIR